jgi:hypothetical protein
VTNADGTPLASATPILAHKIRIHLYRDIYLQFEPGNISIPEIISICKLKMKRDKSKILNMHWGLDRNIGTGQIEKGKFRRTLDGLAFRLLDLLNYEALLPVVMIDGRPTLSADIVIEVSTSTYSYTQGTELDVLWHKWKPNAPDTRCPIDNIKGKACRLSSEAILSGRIQLPSAKGLVLCHNAIIEFTGDWILCYKDNTDIQDILWRIHRLRRANQPHKFNYMIVDPKSGERVVPTHIYDSMSKLVENYRDKRLPYALLLTSPITMPINITPESNLSMIEYKYNEMIESAHVLKRQARALARIWGCE